MKTKEKNTEKSHGRTTDGFDAVKFMREQRNRISKDIMNLSPEEIVKYFDKKQKKPLRVLHLRKMTKEPNQKTIEVFSQ